MHTTANNTKKTERENWKGSTDKRTTLNYRATAEMFATGASISRDFRALRLLNLSGLCRSI